MIPWVKFGFHGDSKFNESLGAVQSLIIALALFRRNLGAVHLASVKAKDNQILKPLHSVLEFEVSDFWIGVEDSQDGQNNNNKPENRDEKPFPMNYSVPTVGLYTHFSSSGTF